MRNNYNFIAPYYDFISRIIFGKAIVRAQTCLLPHILPNSSLLIVGGGSGWILEALAKPDFGTLDITYIDNSAKMIALAKKRNFGNNHVIFICEPVENYLITQKFDGIFTAFLFDNFKQDKTEIIFSQLHHVLKTGGSWFYVDFIPTNAAGKAWQRLLLKTMYLFFKTVSRIETQQLTDMVPFFKSYAYKHLYSKWHYHHFIQSHVYKKE